MCQIMAFGYSLFFKEKYLLPDLLTKAAAQLASELPPLAGRVRPPQRPAGLRKLGETIIDVNNKGVEMIFAETKKHRIEDLGPHTWMSGMHNKKLSSFGVPFYTDPFNFEGMYNGTEPLFKVKLTRCVDGSIVSVMMSHILADAGRGVRLVERLGEIYRSLTTGTDPGPSLKFNPSLETPEGLAAAVNGAPKSWDPPVEDHRLTLGQWLAAPYRMYRHAAREFDVHLLYLPKVATQRLKALANQAQPELNGRLSTNDAVQAFISTLVADLRKKPLVPTFPEEMTVTVDLLHREVAFKEPEALNTHVGNIVHILHVPGVEPGTGKDKLSFALVFRFMIFIAATKVV